MEITRSLFCFVIAGFCEIGGGYLVWLWQREEKNFSFAVLGVILLVLYGIDRPSFVPISLGLLLRGPKNFPRTNSEYSCRVRRSLRPVITSCSGATSTIPLAA